VSDLIDIVVENRDLHRDAYEDALAGFRIEANKALEDRIDQIAQRLVVGLTFRLPIPEDHTNDYDRVIQMLKLTKAAGEDTIVLEQHEQEMYVMDQWGWKTNFAETSTFYAGSK
jgi:hypothetical protein